jgi:predicted CoA-binding protein
MQSKILETLKKKDLRVAIFGATNDSSKYGNIIYKDLKNKNITVYGINPKATTILGDPAYHSIKDIPEKPDILIFVVPPKITFSLIKDAVAEGYDSFWLQPGAESEEIIEYLIENNKNYLANACVMVESR